MTLSRQEEMEERKSVLRNEQRLRNPGTTLNQFAQSEAAEARGRFTAHEQSKVIGSTLVPQYPAGSAWTADPGSQILEPPLSPHDNPALEPSDLASVPPVQGDVGDPDAPSTTASPSVGSMSLSAGRRPFSQRTFRRF